MYAARAELSELYRSLNQNLRLLKDHFERIARDVPRIRKNESALNSWSGTLPTSTTYATITFTNVPDGAIGANVSWWTNVTNNVYKNWRSDSNDIDRHVGVTAGGNSMSEFSVFFADGGVTAQLAFNGAPGTITNNELFVLGWIF